MNKYLIIILFFLFFNGNIYGQEKSKFSNLQWRGSQTEYKNIHIGDRVNIYFKTMNVPENEIINVEIWRIKDNIIARKLQFLNIFYKETYFCNPLTGKKARIMRQPTRLTNKFNELLDLIDELQGTVKNGIVEIEWIVELDLEKKDTSYAREIAEKRYAIVDYVFLIKYDNEIVFSELLEIYGSLYFHFVDEYGEPIRNKDLILFTPKGKFLLDKIDNEGHARIRNLREIGTYNVIR